MKLLFILLMLTGHNPDRNPPEVAPDDARKHVGETVKVCGKITDAKFYEAGKQTLINVGGSQNLTVKIAFDDRKNFSYKPEHFLRNKAVCITGKVIINNGRIELIISRQEDIKIDEDESLEIKANDFDFFNKYFDDK